MTKKTQNHKDPHAAREASNYDKPIVSREFILDHLVQRGAPATHEMLCEEIALTTPEDIEALRRRLIAMCRDGQLVCNRREAYAPIAAVDLVSGRVAGHRDGFGFVIPDEGGSDLFLSARQMRQVFHGDRVLARVDGLDDRGRREAVIVDVIERSTKRVVGRLFRDQGVAFVVPESSRITQEILIPDDHAAGAFHGQYVTVEILQQPSVRAKPSGKVVEVLGDHMAPGMEIDVAIRTHNIPHIWPPELDAEIRMLKPEVADADKIGRVDLRGLPLVTIDGEDARDFDDAVYCAALPEGGWRLLVAIADVSHYVSPGTLLDDLARERATSVYFPDHVIPMLPEILSNGLCSLNPGVDRLCMVCDMTIAKNGLVSSYRFFEAVMHSHARLTYTKVGVILEEPESDRGQALREEYASLVSQLETLHKLYKVLRRARDLRGAIDFETTETRIVFTEERKIEEIVPIVRNVAHKLIEECMLSANVCAARLLKQSKLPGLYRVHEGPGPEKLANLKAFLAEISLSLDGGEDPTPSDYQRLLTQIADRPDANIIQTVMLRSLSQAVYAPELKGHFGLGYEHYTHFTSPIRRYPDLIVHRIIKSLVHGARISDKVVLSPVPAERHKHWRPLMADMVQMGEHCSMAERRADDATRDVMAWLKCEYLQQHIGEHFAGVISAVTGFGFFVELVGVYIEGLVHVSGLNSDYYHFDQVKHRLVGERSGKSFRLGDEVEVLVARVGLDDRKIDLELVQTPLSGKDGKGAGGASGPSARTQSKKGGKGARGASRSRSLGEAALTKKVPKPSVAKPADGTTDADQVRKPRRRRR